MGILGGADTFRVSGADQETFAVWLSEAGYRTGLFGKYLNQYTIASEGNKGEGGTFYIPPGWDRLWAITDLGYGGIHGRDYTTVDETAAIVSYQDHSSDEQYLTDLSSGELQRFIETSHEEGVPFVAVWVPWASHVERFAPPTPADRHYDSLGDIPLHRPESFDEVDRSDKPRWLRAISHDNNTDLYRQRAYETLLSVDEQIADLLDMLSELGAYRSTAIVFTSDNGVSWGEHGVHWARKACPYEECQRVPFVVMYKNGVHPKLEDSDTNRAVLNLDIAPTLADIAGVAVNQELDGVSFKRILQGYDVEDQWRADYMIEHWRIARHSVLSYTGQVEDGDKVRLFFGDTMSEPRSSLLFEFDADARVDQDSIAIRIGANADITFSRLRAWAGGLIDSVNATKSAEQNTVAIHPKVASETAQWWVEVDKAGAMSTSYPIPDHFGVRDVKNGFTFVQHETMERELYDLIEDPYQLENRAGDPAYEEIEKELADRLREMISGR